MLSNRYIVKLDYVYLRVDHRTPKLRVRKRWKSADRDMYCSTIDNNNNKIDYPS